MIGVGARLRYHVDHAAEDPAIFGFVIVGLHFELIDRVDDREHSVNRAAQVGVDDSVEKVPRGAIRLPVKGWLGKAGAGDCRNAGILEANARPLCRGHRCGPRRKGEQLSKIPSV